MIDAYFGFIEKTILDFKAIINSISIQKKAYNDMQGFIKGEIVFNDLSKLCFTEVNNTELYEKIKYRYHYMNKENNLIFRYDNAYHHSEVGSFPNHKHLGERIVKSHEPGLHEILLEIQKCIREELNTVCAKH